jgi:hypothetical protein
MGCQERLEKQARLKRKTNWVVFIAALGQRR